MIRCNRISRVMKMIEASLGELQPRTWGDRQLTVRGSSVNTHTNAAPDLIMLCPSNVNDRCLSLVNRLLMIWRGVLIDHSIVSGFLDFIDHFPLNILLNKAGISISTSNYTILYIWITITILWNANILIVDYSINEKVRHR